MMRSATPAPPDRAHLKAAGNLPPPPHRASGVRYYNNRVP